MTEIPSKEAERGLVLALLRQAGEEPATVLARIRKVPHSIHSWMIHSPELRALYDYVMNAAITQDTVTPQIAAQLTGVTEYSITRLAAGVDLEGIHLYARAVADHAATRAVQQAARNAADLAKRLKPDEAVGRILAEFSNISTEDESARVLSMEESVTRGRAFLDRMQDEIKSGRPRVHFPIPELNIKVPLILPGQMVLLTAQTKVGKTMLAAQMADYNASCGMNVLYFHFEDPPEIMYFRRIARMMPYFMTRSPEGSNVNRKGWSAVSFSRLCGKPSKASPGITLTDGEIKTVNRAEEIISQRFSTVFDVWSSGWTMAQAVGVWRKLHNQLLAASSRGVDLVVIDYLNKAEIDMRDVEASSVAVMRGRDAELVKQTAEEFGSVAVLVQQESDAGLPYETRAGLQKSQVWLSCQRHREPGTDKLSLDGRLVIKNANMGETGSVAAHVDPYSLTWYTRPGDNASRDAVPDTVEVANGDAPAAGEEGQPE